MIFQVKSRVHKFPPYQKVKRQRKMMKIQPLIPTACTKRMGPSRSARFSSSYRGIMGAYYTRDADCAFMTTMDDREPKFSFFSASSNYTSTSYLSEEETTEDIYPCVFAYKLQTYEHDNPTYKYILR